MNKDLIEHASSVLEWIVSLRTGGQIEGRAKDALMSLQTFLKNMEVSELNCDFTPSPWVHEYNDEISIRDSQGGLVAIMGNTTSRLGIRGIRPRQEILSNAKLISTAPDLLDIVLNQRKDREYINLILNKALSKSCD